MTHYESKPADRNFIPGHVVVTGGAGFIGSHLVDLLLAKYPAARITVYDAFTYAANARNLENALGTGRVRIVRNCVTDRGALAGAFKDADTVFHLAAESHVPRSFCDAELFERVNHFGSRCVAKAVAETGVKRLIHVSTDEVYGPSDIPQLETSSLRPTTPYAASKARAEEAVLGVEGIDVRIARPVNAVGPRQHREKLVPAFASAAIAGQAFRIEGTGYQQRVFVSVDDLASALLSIMNADCGTGSAFNIPGDETLSVLEVGRRIARAVNIEARFKFVEDRPTNDAIYSVDGTAISKLGHSNKSDFNREVRRVVQHMRDLEKEPEQPRRMHLGANAPSIFQLETAPLDNTSRQIDFHQTWKQGSAGPHLMSAVRNQKLAGEATVTKKLEAAIKSSTGAFSVWATHSCTGAMEVAALALGIRPGDEVIVPTYTFCATATAFERAGAKIVFADIDPVDFMFDLDSVISRITPRTKAIVPVHYAGSIRNLDSLLKIAEASGIMVVEDAAQAFGSALNGKAAGTAGVIGCYSFHDTKVVSCGQGGMLMLNRPDPHLAARVDAIMNRGTNFSQFQKGLVEHYEWTGPGGSYQLSELNAATLLDTLPHLSGIMEKRSSLAAAYGERLAAYGIRHRRLLPSAGCSSNHHIEALVLDTPEQATELLARLSENGIEARSHYKPLHMSRRGLEIDPDARCPNADAYWRRIVRLPIHTSMSRADVERIAATIAEWSNHQKSSTVLALAKTG